MTQKNKDKKQFFIKDKFWSSTHVRLDKKRSRSHNTIPAKFRHKKKTNASEKDQNS